MALSSDFVIGSLPDAQAHKGIAVLNPLDLDSLEVENGGLVEIKGSRGSIAIARSSRNVESGMVLLDATSRLNTYSMIGERITVAKADLRTLTSVTLDLVGDTSSQDYIDVVGSDRSAIFGRPMRIRDHITMPSPNGGVVELQVVKTSPRRLLQRGISGVVDAETRIEVRNQKAKRPLLETGDVSFADIGGLDDVIKQLQEVAVVPLLHPEVFLRGGKSPIRGILLSGEPGTGKSLLARALARETQATIHSISAPEIIGCAMGESEKVLRELFEEAKIDQPAVIFIDEIDSITPDRDTSSESSRRLVAQLLTLMDGIEDRGQVVVIGATNRISSIDPAVNRSGRFERVIECPVPDKQARESILSIHTRGMPLSSDVDLDELAEVTVGFVGADIDHLCKESVYRSAERIFGFSSLIESETVDADSLEVTMDDFNEAFTRVRPSIKRKFNRDIVKEDFTSIIGHSSAKEALREKILDPLCHPELYEAAGLKIGSGILLHGPPGTGKTALARAAANISGSQFISIKGPELLSMWQGESERAVRNLMDKARKMAPCILFFDEFDAIGADRGMISHGRSGLGSVVNQLLTELDGIDSRDGVLIMAATNRKDLIDPAFLREGRIGTHVKVGLPLPEEYSAIVKVHLADAPLCEQLDLEAAVLGLPAGMSGADLAGIGRKIREIAVRRHLDEFPEGGAEGFSVRQEDALTACGVVLGQETGSEDSIQIEPLG